MVPLHVTDNKFTSFSSEEGKAEGSIIEDFPTGKTWNSRLSSQSKALLFYMGEISCENKSEE